MAKVRIATFNCENLFARYQFAGSTTPRNNFTINETKFDIYSTRSKRLTAKAIKAADADIICLQEVENLHVLDRFNSEFLGWSKAKRYRHRTLMDGNDPRRIDVAFLSRDDFPPKLIRTERHRRNAQKSYWLFSRDCLRVDYEIGGEILTLYGNHFKSMIETRKETRPRRKEQADGVAKILEEDFGSDLNANVVVLGDLNDYPQDGASTTTALGSLIKHPKLVDPMKRLPSKERWTHYWAEEAEYRQLDYILLSKKLDESSGAPKPGRVLEGLPWRAEKVEEERFDDVGINYPKASDHIPVYIDIEVGN